MDIEDICVQTLHPPDRYNPERIVPMNEYRLDGTYARVNRDSVATIPNHIFGKEDVKDMTMEQPVIKNVGDMRVITKSGVGTYREMIPKLIGELTTVLFSPENLQQARMAGPIIFICNDEEYRETDANVEIAIPVEGAVTLPDDTMEVRDLKGGKMLSVMHKGPYHQVGKAYERIMEYAAKTGMKIGGPTRELYLNDPNEVTEDELLTEVQFVVL